MATLEGADVENVLITSIPFWAERNLETWTITGKRGDDPTAEAAFDEIVHDHIALKRKHAAQIMRWSFHGRTKRKLADALGQAAKGDN